MSLAFALDGRACDRPGLIDRDLYVAMNSSGEPLEFKIPASPSGRPWRTVVDTALAPPTTSSRRERAPRIPVLYPYSRGGSLDDHSGLRPLNPHRSGP